MNHPKVTPRTVRTVVVLDKYTLVEPSRTWQVHNWLQYFSPKSLTREFAQSGLRIVETHADVAGAASTEDGDVIAVIAEKM